MDVEKGDGISTVKALGGIEAADIIITASAPGLVAGTVHIPVSADAAKYSPLAAAVAAGSGAVLSFD